MEKQRDMKSIELTEDHKSKLLEMCKELFPEYSQIQFSNPDDPDAGFDSIEGILHLGKFINKGRGFSVLESIHWFEFLISEFFNRLSSKLTLQQKFNGELVYGHNIRIALVENCIDDTTDYYKHPVDYFYEEFKKLKL